MVDLKGLDRLTLMINWEDSYKAFKSFEGTPNPQKVAQEISETSTPRFPPVPLKRREV